MKQETIKFGRYAAKEVEEGMLTGFGAQHQNGIFDEIESSAEGWTASSRRYYLFVQVVV